MYYRSMENNTTMILTNQQRTILTEWFLDCMAEIDGEFLTREVADHYTFALDGLEDADFIAEVVDLMPECLRDLETALALA